jgi:hypothetical protein
MKRFWGRVAIEAGDYVDKANNVLGWITYNMA